MIIRVNQKQMHRNIALGNKEIFAYFDDPNLKDVHGILGDRLFKIFMKEYVAGLSLEKSRIDFNKFVFEAEYTVDQYEC